MINGYRVDQIVASFDGAKIDSILGGVGFQSCYYYHIELERFGNKYKTAEGTLYKILSEACSMSFSQNDGTTFVPRVQLNDGRRSAALQDFVGEVAQVLLGVLERLENPPILKARVADIIWTNRKLIKCKMPIRFAKSALDGYCAIDITSRKQCAFSDERMWLRAIKLALSLKKEGDRYVAVLKSKLLSLYNTLSDNEFGLMLRIGHIFLESELPLDDSTTVTNNIEKGLVRLSAQNHINVINDGYALLIKWYKKDDKQNEINRCLFAKAEINRAIGEKWAAEGIDPGIVSARLEEAQRCYNQLSRQYKVDNGVERLQKKVRKLLHEANKKVSDGMQRFRGDPIDVSKCVETSRKQIHGLSFSSTISRFVGSFNVDVAALRRDIRKLLGDHPVLGLFQHITYEKELVASRQEGIDFRSPDYDKTPLFHQLVVKQFVNQMHFAWIACLWPMFSVLREEHKLKDSDYYSIAESSKFVPCNRRLMVARGIKAGYVQDFQTAAALLLPQIENAVRVHLKAHGSDTFTHNVANEIDSELGLSNLVCRDEMMSLLFDENLAFMMKAMFGPSPNLNLRNQYAHGMIDDCEGVSMYDFYIWYFALKLIIFGCADHPEKLGLKLPIATVNG